MAKTVTLNFKSKELLYDIKNIAYVESDVAQAKTEHDKHQIADITEDGNIDRVTRMLNLAFAECVEYLYPYSKSEITEGKTTDDTLEIQEIYTLQIKVPDSFSATTLNLVESYIHEYMIYKVLSDWMHITNLNNQSSWQNWQEKAENLKYNIQTCLNARCNRVRRTLSPF